MPPGSRTLRRCRLDGREVDAALAADGEYASGEDRRGECSGDLSGAGLGGLPVPGQQVGDLLGGAIGNAGGHVGEPGAGVNVVKLAGFDQRVDRGGTVPAGV